MRALGLLLFPGRSSATLSDRLLLGRKLWLRLMRPHIDGLGVATLPDYPHLDRRHLANCRVVPLRNDILEMLPKGAVGAEVGVQTGDFSSEILTICQPRKLHLIDLDLTTHAVEGRFSAEIATGQVECHEADSADTLERFDEGYFDFIYIDGDHSLEGVTRDIKAAVPRLSQNGWLLFNDYTYWSTVECQPYGIMHAVNRLCLDDEWEIAAYAFGWLGYADVALRRMGRSEADPNR